MASAYNWGNEPPDPRTDPVELNPPPQRDRVVNDPEASTPPAAAAPAAPPIAPQPQRKQQPVAPFRRPAPQPPKPDPQEELANMICFVQSKMLGLHVFCAAIAFLSRESANTCNCAQELTRFTLISYNELMSWGLRYSVRPTVTVDDSFSDEALYGGKWLEVLQVQIEELVHCFVWIASHPLASPGFKHWTTTTLSHLDLVMNQI